MSHPPATKKKILAEQLPFPLCRIHAIMLGLEKPTQEEQLVITMLVMSAAQSQTVSAMKHMSAETRLALAGLAEVNIFKP